MLAPNHRTRVRALLWDFGATLCDERWMLSPVADEPRWAVACQTALAAGDLVRRWDLGMATAREVANAASVELGLKVELIEQHMRACSRKIRFHRGTMRLASLRAAPQAIVTINSDLHCGRPRV